MPWSCTTCGTVNVSYAITCGKCKNIRRGGSEAMDNHEHRWEHIETNLLKCTYPGCGKVIKNGNPAINLGGD